MPPAWVACVGDGQQVAILSHKERSAFVGSATETFDLSQALNGYTILWLERWRAGAASSTLPAGFTERYTVDIPAADDAGFRIAEKIADGTETTVTYVLPERHAVMILLVATGHKGSSYNHLIDGSIVADGLNDHPGGTSFGGPVAYDFTAPAASTPKSWLFLWRTGGLDGGVTITPTGWCSIHSITAAAFNNGAILAARQGGPALAVHVDDAGIFPTWLAFNIPLGRGGWQLDMLPFG